MPPNQAWYGGNPFGGPTSASLLETMRRRSAASGGWGANGNAATVNTWGSALVNITDDSSSAVEGSAGAALRQNTSAALNNTARLSGLALTGAFSGLPVHASRVGFETITDVRFWVCCLTNNITNTLNSGVGASANMVGFRFDTGLSDTTLKFLTNDGGAVGTVIDTGVVLAAQDVYDFGVEVRNGSVLGEIYDMDGRLLWSELSVTDLPAAAAGIFLLSAVRNIAALAVKSIDQYEAEYGFVGATGTPAA